ncbi:hypothetical protein O181_010114 [Austropuccinia psidii MF-1]|uniref:Uncharacterized protein n=1 Tax=Austropuccinia psidii MF-1 TaxID=1389203 RepID=A0A9Q3BQF0_9BASI|nr:hypothetical protein [Austropuccinia psidii MF-1]
MSFWQVMASKPYPASFASLANSQSQKPPGQYLNSGPEDHLAFKGPLDPLTLSRPPTASMFHGPWAMAPRGEVHQPQFQVVSKPQFGPPGPVFGLKLKRPKTLKLAQGPKTLNLAISLNNQGIASGNHQRPPATFNKRFLPMIRGTSGPTQWTQVCRNQERCLYGVIYHHAPSFLSNPMEILSGPHYAITKQVPRPNTHFEGRLQPPSFTIHGGY